MTMPKGKPNTQTKATDKYQKKAGIIAKTFKLKKEVIEAYKEACEKAGVSQAGQLTKMMNEFIEQVNGKQ